MKDIALSTLGIVGILLHSLIKFYQQKKAPTWAILKDYYKNEWLPMFISALIVVVALICKKEILQLDIAGNLVGGYLGLIFFTIGYLGQMVLLFLIGKVAAKTGIKDEVTPLILLLISVTFITSCANERKFVKFHDNNEITAAGHCASWYPNKDSVHQETFFREGEKKYIPGPVIYANCDSAYVAALNEAVRLGNAGNIKVPPVKIPCPPSTQKHDTIREVRYERVNNTAMEVYLRGELSIKTNLADNKTAEAKKWKTRATYEGGFILFLIIATIAYIYYWLLKRK